MVFPVIPGKSESLTAFANKILNERKAEYEISQASVTKESWFLQPTPAGDVCVVVFEAPDPSAVFAGLAESQEPFDVWFRGQVLENTGVDLSQPGGGMPTRIFHWSRE
jgi:hypothetical protein